MSDFIKKNKDIFILVAICIFAVLIVYLPSLINGSYFIGGGDARTQCYPFYVLYKNEIVEALKNKTLPFYSWQLFLGSNLYASKGLSYGLFDIYSVIGYVLRLDFFKYYDITCCLKIIVSAITAYYFFKYIFTSRRAILLGSICYALSSFALYFTSFPYFLSFYSLVPLYFLGIEKYLKENKGILFIISIVFLSTMCGYLFFSISLFSPLYFLYRYFNINKSFKGWFVSALKLVGIYLIAICCVMIVLLPEFIYILGNSRVASGETSLLFSDIKIYLHLISATIFPSQTYIYDNNVFNQDFHGTKELLLYCGSLVALLLPQFITNKDKKYRYSTLVLYILIVILLFTKYGNSAMNGFSISCFRWTYLVILMNIFTCLTIVDEDEYNTKLLKVSFGLTIIIPTFCFVLAIVIKNQSLSEYTNQAFKIAIAYVFLAINLILILKNAKKYLICVCTVELVIFALLFGIKSLGTAEPFDRPAKVTTVIANDRYSFSEYLDSLDENNASEFFRIYVPYESLYWSYSYNMNIFYGIKGVVTYDSAYAPSLEKLVEINHDGTVKYIDWNFDIQDENIMNMLCVKYSITINEDEIPFTNYEIVDNNYNWGMIVAKNLDYISFGTTYNNSITYEKFYDEYYPATDVLAKTLLSDDEVNNSSSLSSAYNVYYKNNWMVFDIDVNEKSTVLLQIPFDEGWTIKVNGEVTEKRCVSGGLMAIDVLEGNNHIEMNFVSKGFYVGAIFSALGICVFIVFALYEKRRNKL